MHAFYFAAIVVTGVVARYGEAYRIQHPGNQGIDLNGWTWIQLGEWACTVEPVDDAHVEWQCRRGTVVPTGRGVVVKTWQP